MSSMSTLQDAPQDNHNGQDIGESSEDESCLCGKLWTPDQPGWPLCDTPNCPNTVCAQCAQIHQLIVSELFFCPPCAGSGQSAAATVGGAVATAVAALSSALERLPMSRATLRKILDNIQQHPRDPKFRRLRLENRSIKEYIDLEPVRRILTSIGFVQKEEPRVNTKEGVLPPTESFLVLEGDFDVDFVREIIDVLDGLSSKDDETNESGPVDDEETNADAAAAAAATAAKLDEGKQTSSPDKEMSASTASAKYKHHDDDNNQGPNKKAKHGDES